VEHYDQSFLDPEDSLFQDKALVDQYVLQQWRLTYNNTFYAIDDVVFSRAFTDDITRFPHHLGIAWHLGKEPLEIFTIAKKLVDLCDPLPPEGAKLKALRRHLDREVSSCADEIKLQTRLSSSVMVLDLARAIVEGNFARGTNPLGFGRRICTTLTQDSVIPAIIIKRHRLLEYRYDMSSIYTTVPACNAGDEHEPVLSIDQLRECVAHKFYARAGRSFDIQIEGTWEDCKDTFQEELPFILPFTAPEP